MPRRPLTAGSLAVLALALAACGPADGGDPRAAGTDADGGTASASATPGDAASAAPGASGSATPSTAAFPLTVSTCGVETTLVAPPERIVTIKSSATEMVLALGAGDRLVATAYPDGEVPADLPAPAADVPVLAEKNPSSEAVLALAPDLVYAGWESNLSADAAGERSRYEDLGISTLVSPSACKGAAHKPDRLTFDAVFAEITQAGAVLGAEDAAAALVAAQRAELAALEPSGAGRTALWYSSGSDIPYVGAGTGAPQMLMEAVGLENIAADVADTWTSLAWEAVADRDPDVIVLVDSAWNTAEHKIEILESNPVTAVLPAVREERYVVVDFPATEAGVRNVPAATDLAAQLAALDGAPPA
ncbi:putative F420-0 ABC transporter substrate-binding protein [Georgenia wangjunii]|uniref:putative F420-0 ABC transporter substrate-binding protein n=1 Tax=Georgenia wangjunii TaxID=3117730 RepID=UPI002F25FC9B